jgi:putative tricarboxylic transport membrane protein
MTSRAFAAALITALGISLSTTYAQSLTQLRLIAPAAPGGGWDQTARVMQQALQREGLARLAPVENIPGAAGTIGLARFIGAERGRGDVLMVSGLIMLGGIVTHQSPVTLRDVVPIARLTGEYEVIAVPAASPLRSLQDLIAAFRAQPGSISWGGGSAGGSDQILAGLVADALGIEPKRVNYIAFSGGGESMSAILGGTVSVGINGYAEFAPQLEIANASRASTSRHCASRVWTSSSRTGDRWSRHPASRQAIAPASRPSCGHWCSRPPGASRWRVTGGSIAISMARRSLASSTRKRPVCDRS